MSFTPLNFRRTIALAMTDAFMHDQPGMQHRHPDFAPTGTYEVRGTVDVHRLGATASQQVVTVMEREHPGILAVINDRRVQLDKAEIAALIETEGDPAQAVIDHLRERLAFIPDFTDL